MCELRSRKNKLTPEVIYSQSNFIKRFVNKVCKENTNPPKIEKVDKIDRSTCSNKLNLVEKKMTKFLLTNFKALPNVKETLMSTCLYSSSTKH